MSAGNTEMRVTVDMLWGHRRQRRQTGVRGDRCLGRELWLSGEDASPSWGNRQISSLGRLANALVLVRPGFESQILHLLTVTLDMARL